jgi:hypothetical protein
MDFDNYDKMFELGFAENNPAVKVLDSFDVCPISLAALVTALFETVMRTIPDDKQISFEKNFNKSLKTLMKKRHECELKIQFPEDSDEN